MGFVKFVTVLCLCCILSSDWHSRGLAADPTAPTRNQHTLCRGTSFGLNRLHSSDLQYERYRLKYANCTYVDGNLELTHLDRNYNLSFLRDIQEVTGYVLIYSVMSEQLWLRNLRIIRGQATFLHEGRRYGLFVSSNYDSTPRGLKELQLTSLHEIMVGDVFFQNNLLLCHEKSIDWQDILPLASVVNSNDTLPKRRTCGNCDSSCGNRCWGSGAEMCQKMTKKNCNQVCGNRCRDDAPGVCCHGECAGGCSGPTSSSCWACKNFANDGSCVNLCPPPFIYEHYRQVPNPAVKYSHGSLCLDKCPNYLYAYRGACVRDCDRSQMAVDGKCVPCDEKCPKTCPGLDVAEFLHAGNIASFNGCSIVQNSITILPTSFTGDPRQNLVGISESDLSVFETVTEIAGHLRIEGNQIKQIDYFRNLRIIHGISTAPNSSLSLKVSGTRLESLNFQSLKEIRNGDVAVENNPKLCFANVSWSTLFFLPEQMSFVSQNLDQRSCARNNQTCFAECSLDGCWGPGDEQCLSCEHFHLERHCLESCDAAPGLYKWSSNECHRCHEECKTKCSNSSSAACDECKNVKDGDNCVSSCPNFKYSDSQKTCQLCHPNCEGACAGGENTVGPQGCHSCGLVILDLDDNVERCQNISSSCGDGYFKKTIQDYHIKELNGKQACKRCHPECRICDEYSLSLSSCKSCLYFQQEDRCVRNCSSDYYVKNNTNVCLRCDSRCLSCVGPTASDCTVCKQYVVYHDSADHSQGFNCTETCPDHMPHKIIDESASGEKVTVCVTDDGGTLDAATIGKIVGSVIGGVIFLAIVTVVIVVMSYKRAQAEANKVKLTAQLFGVAELEPLALTTVGPDLATLRLIKESELRRGSVIGKGAFGTVFRGMWIPENEHVKLVVAIKVIDGKSPSENEEMLEEARIMASVSDQYCVRILAFCMTAQMMIITQLMPHGCLLDFIKKHRTEIGSKVLLNWCTQIAKGMTYLEEKSIVHRDLAARNILVQHPEHIRITDFGLSKLLDYNENEVHSVGEKVPPWRWMALESILSKVFTHKSDVWSYGVTLWELFTYGLVPYERVANTNEIADVLVKGERLTQPQICTIDVYMLMIKCWVIDAASRPTFRLLADEFAKMARDPGRFLVINGDEFKRIPVQPYGMKDLMRYASMDSGGNEMMITADDYLHRPRGRVRSSDSQGHSDHLQMVEETGFDETDGSPHHGLNMPSSSFPGDTLSSLGQRLRRNSRNRDPSTSVMRQQSEPGGGRPKNGRYCSDPCKAALLQHHLPTQRAAPATPSNNIPNLNKTESQSGGGSSSARSSGLNTSPVSTNHDPVFSPVKSPNAGRPMGHATPLSPRFSTGQEAGDEDGEYLQPAGHQKTTTPYVDLIDNADGDGTMTSFISNPEYFEGITGSPGEAVAFLPSPKRRSRSPDSAKYYNDFTSNHNAPPRV